MKLYNELAHYWQLISPTSDYADEGAFINELFKKAGAKTILELGAGGGNVAFYLKDDFAMTLTDLSPDMLNMSKQQNPNCEHVVGDMRTLDLGRTFDGVLVHDAIVYMTTENDLLAVIHNAAKHLKVGGTIVLAPDCTLETFKTGTEFEGHDQPDRSVRYLQWVSDPDPTDTVYDYDFIIGIKEGGVLKTYSDQQTAGIFPRQTWLDLLDQAGFDAKAIPDSSSQGEAVERTEVFVGTKR